MPTRKPPVIYGSVGSQIELAPAHTNILHRDADNLSALGH